MGIFMGIFIGMFEICVYAPGPATPRPPPHGMGPIYCPYEIFPLPLWCGRGVWHCPPPPPVVWWGCGTVPPSPRCGVVGVWYCPPPPLWCGGGVVWYVGYVWCVWSVWYGMFGKYGMFGRYGKYSMNGWYCMDGRYGM